MCRRLKTKMLNKYVLFIMFCICLCCSKVIFAEEQIIDNVINWLKSGSGRTLIVSRAFFSPPVFTTDDILYKSDAERDKYYYNLGIWTDVKCIEYKIKDIRWTDKIMPQIEINNKIQVFALLPEKDIEDNLPSDSKILLEGKTNRGDKVPLIYELKNGNNRIINITFSLKQNFELEKSVMLAIFSYIAKTDEINPLIPCTAHTGLPAYYKGKVWESKVSFDKSTRKYYEFDLEAPRQGEGTISSVLLSSPFIKNGKPTFAGISLIEEPITPVRFDLSGNICEVDIINLGGMFMSNIDKSVLYSNYASHFNRIVIASANTNTQWGLETLDGQDYVHTDIFNVFSERSTEFSFLRPDYWAQEEWIHAFKVDENILNPVQIRVDKSILIMDVEPGNYIVYYGMIQEKQLTEFWKKFLDTIPNTNKEKFLKLIEAGITDYRKYIDQWNNFSINWIEW